ncbi:hypothetical protein ACOSP7_024265 [Xanthoceras sorbifolium]
MAVRVFLVFGVLLFFIAQVSSDLNIEEEDVTHVGQKAHARHRLWRVVQAEVQSSLKAKPVQQSMWHVLCEVQVCATRHFREQGGVWKLLHRHDYSWKQNQVPIGPYPTSGPGPIQTQPNWVPFLLSVDSDLLLSKVG